MPVDKNKDSIKGNSIPSKIVEAISSVFPEDLNPIESCPSFFVKDLNITESNNEIKNKKKIEKEYKIGNYLIKKTLGQGTFGKVKLGIYLPNKEKVAIKILEKNRIIEKDDEIRVKREFDMLALFNHPNVILVAEIFESSDSYYSVMEYCQGGELFNYIVKNRRLSDEEASFFYFQLINGLEYLHSLGIVHRDLKPENLLLTNEHLLKIIDFGLSNYFHEGQKKLLSTPCGSPCYASPEMVAGKKYNGFKIDIWSTGIILYAMLCGYLPFEDKDNDLLFEKILECKLVFPKYISKKAKDLMQKILVTDPEKRITIPEIKKHPFYLAGKKLFEQDFSIYQINKDYNEKNSSADLNNTLNTPELKGKKDNDVFTSEKKENTPDNNQNEKNFREKKEKSNKRKIKEIEIKLNNKINETKKPKNNISKNSPNKYGDINIDKKIKTYELETHAHTLENSGKLNSKDSNREKIKHFNKPKKEKVKKLSLLKESNNDERRRLIKNARKLNIKNGSHRFRATKKLNDLISYNNLKNSLFQVNKLNIFSKNSVNKKLEPIQRKFNSKDDLNFKINFVSENVLLNNNVSNTIENDEISTKKKLKMNFQRLKLNSNKKKKKAKSISKNNMKLSLLEASKFKKIKNSKFRKNQINTSVKKNKNKTFNLSNNNQLNKWNNIKYNLLHKKNLKEININLQNAKKMILSKEEKKIVDKKNSNNNNKIYNTNSLTIDTPLNNNNMNTIENNKNINNNIKERNSNIKLKKKNIYKKLPSKPEKLKKDKIFMRTMDKERNYHYINKTSVNLNAYLQSMVEKKSIKENNNKKHVTNPLRKNVNINKTLNINVDNINNNKKKHLINLIDKSDNLDSVESLLKTEPNQNRFTKILNPSEKKNNINKSNSKYLKDNKNTNQFLQVKLPLFSHEKKNKVNYIKKQKNENIINKINIPKNLNHATHNSNFHSFIQNPFTSTNKNSINKLLFHENNGSFNQSEQNLNKKLNEKNNLNYLNNTSKKKPLVSIRNTVINFNMIDSGFILDPLKRKKTEKRLLSVNKLQNNHLFGLCNKFNNNFSLNNNNLILNNDYYLKKTNTINAQNNNKIFRYRDKNNGKKLIGAKHMNNNDKSHVKYNSMRLDDFSRLKSKKNYKNINTNKIENTINNNNKLMNFELNHFNTINN